MTPFKVMVPVPVMVTSQVLPCVLHVTLVICAVLAVSCRLFRIETAPKESELVEEFLQTLPLSASVASSALPVPSLNFTWFVLMTGVVVVNPQVQVGSGGAGQSCMNMI